MARLDPLDVADSAPDRAGWVYVLTHPHMNVPRASGTIPLLKIGATRKHPIRRATELSMGTGVPGDFTVAYFCAAPDAFAVEGATHEVFDSDRVDRSREFFASDLTMVVEYIREYVRAVRGVVFPSDEGGEWIENGGRARKAANLEVSTPMSELFASFPDDGGDRELTPEESALTRALIW